MSENIINEETVSENKNEVERPFETLELLAAILLGLAAIATSFASYQSSLYGGKGAENFSLSNKLATEGAAERSRAIVQMSRDSTAEMEAWRLTEEGDAAGNPEAEERNYRIATYLYMKVMSETGYKAMGLPLDLRKKYDEEDAADNAAEGSPEAEAKQAEAEEKQNSIQETVLETAQEHELAGNAVYEKEMLAKSQGLFDEAEKTFKAGQQMGGIGDKFQLIALIFAISLFFGGIVQVFRNDRMRWGILGAGAVLFIIATVYLLTLPFTFS